MILALGKASPDRVAALGEHLLHCEACIERVHQFIQGYIDRNEIAGAVTLVARKGKIVHFDAQGLRSKEDQTPM